MPAPLMSASSRDDEDGSIGKVKLRLAAAAAASSSPHQHHTTWLDPPNRLRCR